MAPGTPTQVIRRTSLVALRICSFDTLPTVSGPVLTTTEVGGPSTPSTLAHTRTVYSVSGSSLSSSATAASPGTSRDSSGPWPDCQEILYLVAPGTLFQAMVTDELLL